MIMFDIEKFLDLSNYVTNTRKLRRKIKIFKMFIERGNYYVRKYP